MYFYIYDSFLQDKKYAKLITEIEAKLIDLSIQGRTSKLNILNDIKEMIVDAVKRGAETVVVLGDDKTVAKAIGAVSSLDITLGIIPLGSGTHTIAEHLGIPYGLAACEVISKRIRERIDVGRVSGGNFVVFYLKALSSDIKIISEDGSYSVTPISPHTEVYLCNFRPFEVKLESARKTLFSPTDGHFELIIHQVTPTSFVDKLLFKNATRVGGYTVMPFSKLRLEGSDPEKDIRLLLDGDKIIKPPVDIEVLPQKVKVIVGSERMF
jgi:diacylglycerol kinase family enzyme